MNLERTELVISSCIAIQSLQVIVGNLGVLAYNRACEKYFQR